MCSRSEARLRRSTEVRKYGSTMGFRAAPAFAPIRRSVLSYSRTFVLSRAGAPKLAFALIGALGAAGWSRADPTPARELRVCADPNNLPFSNRAGEGFENRIADLIARDLHEKVAYTWATENERFVRT